MGVRKINRKSKLLIAILIVLSIIILPRIYVHIKYLYIFNDINELVKQSKIHINLKDSFIEGQDGFSPNVVYVRTTSFLKTVKSIVQDILMSNRQKNIDADGMATMIYFGDYVISQQGAAGLWRIQENGELSKIKSASPAGEVISSEIHGLYREISNSYKAQ